jgi:hypothetical protein
MRIMACEECPLKKLKPGDEAINAYHARWSALRRMIFRANCPRCSTGYVDFFASNANVVSDDTSRFVAKVERVISVSDCGREKS